MTPTDDVRSECPGCDEFEVTGKHWHSCPGVAEDERVKAVLFNDITSGPDWFNLSERQRLADHLWAQGWRRDVRPENVNDPRPSTDGLLGADPGWAGGQSVDDYMNQARRR